MVARITDRTDYGTRYEVPDQKPVTCKTRSVYAILYGQPLKGNTPDVNLPKEAKSVQAAEQILRQLIGPEFDTLKKRIRFNRFGILFR